MCTTVAKTSPYLICSENVYLPASEAGVHIGQFFGLRPWCSVADGGVC